MRRSRFEKHQKRNKEVLEKWVNLKLEPRKRKVENLETDFRDGVNLCVLFEELSKKRLPKYFKKPKNDIQKTENLRIVLKPINEFIQGVGIQLQFTPSSIMRDKKLRIVSLLLILFKKFEIPSLHDDDEEEEEEVEGEESTKSSQKSSQRKKVDKETVKTKVDRLKQFTQTVLEPYREQYNISVIDFDSSWKNGIAFNCLLHAIDPNLVNLDDINPNDPRGNIENALNIATSKLGLPQLIEVDDIAENPNPTVIMMFLAMLYQHYLNELKKRKKREQEAAELAKKKKQEEEESDSDDPSSDDEESSDEEEKEEPPTPTQQHSQRHDEIMMKNPEVPESLETLRMDISILKQHLMMVKQQVEHQNWVIRNLKEEKELADLRSNVMMRMILKCHPNSFPLEWLSEGMRNSGFRMGFPLLQCELQHQGEESEEWKWNITSPFKLPVSTSSENPPPQYKKNNPYECNLSESRHFVVEGLKSYDWSSHFKISFRASPTPMIGGKGRGVFVLEVAGSWRIELSLVKTLVGSLVELRMDVILKTVHLGRVKAKLRKRWKPKSTRNQQSEKDILNYCVYFNGRKLTVWAEGPKYVIGEKEIVTLKRFTSVKISESPLRVFGYTKLQKKDIAALKEEEEEQPKKKKKKKKKKMSKKRKKKSEEEEEDDEDYLKVDENGKMGVKIGQDKRFTHPTYIEIISIN